LVGEGLSDDRRSVLNQMLSNLLEDLIVKWLQVYPLVLRRSKKLGEFLMKGLVGLRWLLPLVPVL